MKTKYEWQTNLTKEDFFYKLNDLCERNREEEAENRKRYKHRHIYGPYFKYNNKNKFCLYFHKYEKQSIGAVYMFNRFYGRVLNDNERGNLIKGKLKPAKILWIFVITMCIALTIDWLSIFKSLIVKVLIQSIVVLIIFIVFKITNKMDVIISKEGYEKLIFLIEEVLNE